MITKTFTQNYPDQPWAAAVTDGNSVTVTWKGTRYYTFSRVTASGGVHANDDEDYVYEYNVQNFVQSLYNGQEAITYNVDSDTFTMPGFLVHPLSNTGIFTAYEEEAERIDSAVTGRADEFTADELTALKASSVWLKGVRARYGSIEPWKIPHPEHGVTY